MNNRVIINVLVGLAFLILQDMAHAGSWWSSSKNEEPAKEENNTTQTAPTSQEDQKYNTWIKAMEESFDKEVNLINKDEQLILMSEKEQFLRFLKVLYFSPEYRKLLAFNGENIPDTTHMSVILKRVFSRNYKNDYDKIMDLKNSQIYNSDPELVIIPSNLGDMIYINVINLDGKNIRVLPLSMESLQRGLLAKLNLGSNPIDLSDQGNKQVLRAIKEKSAEITPKEFDPKNWEER